MSGLNLNQLFAVMKKIVFKFALLSLIIISLVSCKKDDDNIRLGYDYISTVIEKDDNRIILAVDGGVKYYESALINNRYSNFELGDRIYLNYFMINYDEQPDNADGSRNNPYMFKNVVYTKMNLVIPIDKSEETDNIKSELITYICQPYLKKTEIGKTYLNIFWDIKDNSEPVFNLIYNGKENDEYLYKLKVTYKNNSNSPRTVRYAKSFLLEQLSDEGKVRVEFDSKFYESSNKAFDSDSTFVLDFENAY